MPVSPSFTKDHRASTSPAKKLREPGFTVAWESRRETLKTSFQAVVSGPKPPKDAPQSSPSFRYAWVRQPLPKRALLASALWHIILIYVPLPYWGEFVRQTNFAAQLGAPTDELVYYGPVKDLPLVNPKGLPAKPSPDRKSTRLNSSHGYISYAVFCLKKKNNKNYNTERRLNHICQPC